MQPQPVTKEEPSEEQPLQASSVARGFCKAEEVTPKPESISRTDVTHDETGETEEKYSIASPSHMQSGAWEPLEQQFQPSNSHHQKQWRRNQESSEHNDVPPTVSQNDAAQLNSQGRLPCPECEEKFKLTRHLARHIKCTHPQFYKRICRFFCSKCGSRSKFATGFITRNSAQGHIDTAHTVKGVAARVIEIDGDRLQCSECDEAFPFKGYLTAHIKLNHREAYQRLCRFFCPTCGVGFIRHYAMENHIICFHGVSALGAFIDEGARGIESWNPPPMGAEDAEVADLKEDSSQDAAPSTSTAPPTASRNQATLQHKKGWHRCLECDEAFKFKQHHTQHIKEAHPEAYKGLIRFLCPICNAGYLTHVATMSHINKVHKVKGVRVIDIHSDGGARGSQNGKPPPMEASQQGDEHSEAVMMKEMHEEKNSSQDAASSSKASEKHQHEQLEQNDLRTCHHQNQPSLHQESRDHNDEPSTSFQNQAPQKQENVEPSNGQLRCPECGQERPTSEALQRHLLIVHPENFFICPECHGCFPTRISIVNHIYSSHAMLDTGMLISAAFNSRSQGTSSESQPAHHGDSYDNDHQDHESTQAKKRRVEKE